MKTISGWHHITNIASDAQKNYEFYTEVLGMRLLKKTVNQDDISAYHTFFGDENASAGNDLTFFDFPEILKELSLSEIEKFADQFISEMKKVEFTILPK